MIYLFCYCAIGTVLGMRYETLTSKDYWKNVLTCTVLWPWILYLGIIGAVNPDEEE